MYILQNKISLNAGLDVFS